MDKLRARISQIRLYIKSLLPTFQEEKEWKSILLSTVTALVLAFVFRDSIFQGKEAARSAVLAITMSCIWVGIMNSVLKICNERQMVVKAQKEGLFVTSYMIAHALYQVLLCFLQALVMTVVYMVILKTPKNTPALEGYVLYLFFNLFFIIYAADMLGLLISAIAKSSISAMKIMVVVLLLQLVFSGKALPLSGTAEEVSMASISRWGEQALGITVNMNAIPSRILSYNEGILKSIDGLDELVKVLPSEVIQKSKMALDNFLYYHTYEKGYVFQAGIIQQKWIFLALNAVLYLMLAVLALKVIDYDRKKRILRKKR